MQKQKHIAELLTLEELFLDQMNFKLRSVFSIQTISRKHQEELLSFMQELEELTEKNRTLLQPYV